MGPANATLSRLGGRVSSAPRRASTAREEMHLSERVFRVQQAVVPKPEPAPGDNSLHPPFTFHLQLINAAYCLAETTQAASRSSRRKHADVTRTLLHTQPHKQRRRNATRAIASGARGELCTEGGTKAMAYAHADSLNSPRQTISLHKHKIYCASHIIVCTQNTARDITKSNADPT